VTSLSEFFDAVVPMLRGETSSAEFEARVGSSRSGSRRVSFYRTLMRRNVRLLLGALYPHTRRAALGESPELWSNLVDRFDASHPASHWDVNEFGRPFPDFLGELARAGEVPACLEELADYEWICFAVGVEPDENVRGLGLDRTLYVREYDHDVPSFVKKEETGLPRAGSSVVIVYRSPEDKRARFLRPTPVELCVIARRQGTEPPDTLSREALAAAEQKLVSLGVIPR
jgi:hypothetical protein